MATAGAFTADGNQLIELTGPRGTTGSFNTLYANGDFGGGTLNIEVSPDGGTTWFAITETELTVVGLVNFQAEFSHNGLRVVLAGATAPSLNYWVL